jgi:predicted DNA-binding transcriptional regulator AlpA
MAFQRAPTATLDSTSDPWRGPPWLARQIGMSEKTIHDWLAKGGILPPHHRFGTRTKWRESALLAWIASREMTAHAG